MKLCFPEKILAQHLVVLGKTGAGKSSALRHIVEHLLSHNKRVCIIDIKGDWWGLKSSADGKSAGFPVIAFGNFREPKATDVPINSKSGEHVAELITSGNRPCIIGFRGWMPADIAEFWIGTEHNRWNGFASTLFNKNEGELYVVISECHNFAPKGKVLDPRSGRMLHWTNRLLTEGRGLGMSFLLDSQRPQKVHNDTLTSCETLVAMRVTYPADRDAIEEWIRGCGDESQGKEVLRTLANMERGEAWMWSPENGFGPTRIKFPMFETFDSFAPAQLQKKIGQSGWSSVDLEAVKQKLASVIEEAKSNDPAELKKIIAELRSTARKFQAQPRQTDAKAIEAAAATAINKATYEFNAKVAVLEKDNARLREGFQRIGQLSEQFTSTPAPQIDRAAVQKVIKTVPVPPPRRSAPPALANGSGEITGPMQRILNACAWMESIGVNDPKQEAVAFLAGYTVGGGAFNNPRGALRVMGLIEYTSRGMRLTEAGRTRAQLPDTPLTTQELHNRVLAQLPTPEQKLLKVLLEAYPEAVDNDQLARAAGYEPGGGAFNNPRGRLRTLGLVEYPQKGQVKAADLLFLEAA